MKKYLKIIIPIIVAALVACLAILHPFYSIDAFITDKVYTRLTGTTPEIIIVSIDEEAVDEYGNFNNWSREKTAELIDHLYADPENSPAVVTVDIMFIDPFKEPDDTNLINAVKNAGNTILATNIVYRGVVERDNEGNRYYNEQNIAAVEVPFDELRSVTTSGFSNACIANDGSVRYAMNTVTYKDPVTGESVTQDSLAYATYKEFMKFKGKEVDTPPTNGLGQFQFFYSGESREFSHVSLSEVLKGNIPASAFRDKIVLFGAYAPGFQDAYQSAIDRGTNMYGVEIHANIIQAYMQHKTAQDASKAAIIISTLLIVGLFLILANYQKLVYIIIEGVAIIIAYLFAGRMMASKGVVFPQLYIILAIVLGIAYYIIEKYFIEKLRRKKTLEVFKKYVAPQVVDDISKSGDFVLKLGGEKRHVAVLFVDIRGFTPLSESLNPEQVVAILNEYLALTTKSILSHSGTLDKFIGDATMAVFNAPFDQDDYIYEAVAAAWDIKQGSQELRIRLEKEFGKTVGFGVGVNCGDAVVGNIGCDFRMDYTAIGDTVNTAARLEANAKAEEILISEYVYDRIKDRIEAEEVGEIPLKGKSTKLMVYRVLGI